MNRVVVIILHAVPGSGAGPLETAFAAVRAANAKRHARAFEAAGATARVIEVQPGGAPFGTRLRRLAALDAGAGFIVLGSGAVPLAGAADRRALMTAAEGAGHALTNNIYSGDVVAIPAKVSLGDLPELASDNGLPRWLAGKGHQVRDLRSKWRLQVDLDSPLDAFIVGTAAADDPDLERVRAALARLRATTSDGGAELVLAGRTSAATITWLEGATASRTRALVEERGFRTATPGQRPTRSILGLALDSSGPERFGAVLTELGEAAVIDTRVLIAHRFGRDEAGWPSAEDRFASDLLLHERVTDPWLGALTRSAAEASIPVLLGGHTLVGPGLRLLLAARRK